MISLYQEKKIVFERYFDKINLIYLRCFYCILKQNSLFSLRIIKIDYILFGGVGCGESVVSLVSTGLPTDIGLPLGKACYSCGR